MRNLGIVAAVLVVPVMAAQGTVFTTAADGALQLRLVIDYSTGGAVIENVSGATVQVDGYELWSAGGKLIVSGSGGAGWVSFNDVIDQSSHTGLPAGGAREVLADSLQRNLAGNYASWWWVAGWGDMKNSATFLCEATLSSGGQAFFRSGVAQGIGHPFSVAGRSVNDVLADLSIAGGNGYGLYNANPAGAGNSGKFFYTRPGFGGNKFAGQVEIVSGVAPAGDANRDGLVDLQDFGLVKANFGKWGGAAWGEGDFNGDGIVDLQDFGILRDHYGQTAGGALSAPAAEVAAEPGSVSVLALAAAAGFRRRRGV